MSNYTDYHPCYFHCFIKNSDLSAPCGGHLCGRITRGILVGLGYLLAGALSIGITVICLLLIGSVTEFVIQFSSKDPWCNIRNAGALWDFSPGLCIVVGITAMAWLMTSFIIFNVILIPLYVYLKELSKICKIMVVLLPVYTFGIQLIGVSMPHIFNQPNLQLKCNMTSYYSFMNENCFWMGCATWGVIMGVEYLVILIWFLVRRYREWYGESKVYQKTYGSMDCKA